MDIQKYLKGNFTYVSESTEVDDNSYIEVCIFDGGIVVARWNIQFTIDQVPDFSIDMNLHRFHCYIEVSSNFYTENLHVSLEKHLMEITNEEYY